jgi:hypothetical protein
MARVPIESSFVVLALGLWILASSASLAEDDDPNALNQQVDQLIEQGKYQETIPTADEAAHHSGNAPEALAEVQRNWLLKLRTEKGLAHAVNLAGPFIMSSQGKL